MADPAAGALGAGAGGEIAAGPDFPRATDAVSRFARRTPLLEVPALSHRLGRPVLLKLESLQVTGSFKVRGAAARLQALTDAERQVGVVVCSSGCSWLVSAAAAPAGCGGAPRGTWHGLSRSATGERWGLRKSRPGGLGRIGQELHA